MRSGSAWVALGLLFGGGVACSSGSSGAAGTLDASSTDAIASGPDEGALDAQLFPSDAAPDDAQDAAPDASQGAGCTTTITYGTTWIHGASHPSQSDVASGLVTWDGGCTDDGASSYAVLSNGWKPYFSGHGCVMALDTTCGAPASCRTRVTYGAAWIHAAGHAAQYDDWPGRLTWDGTCANGVATLSNGWTPTFSGADACAMSFAYAACGGLYQNPVVDVDCPDPGVVRDGARYVMACTSGGAADAFPIRTSRDLVSWQKVGSIFPSGHHPSWATGDFWAPEIHRVGAQWVAYFTARNTDGVLSIGAATAPSATGPFTDRGAPLLHDPSMGLIDPSEFEAADGTRYLLWKEDGNAVGKHTPIHVQQLAADGLSLVGAPVTAITNDRAWEGPLVEGPWMIAHGGSFYLFYSANGYASTAYAVGVASAPSPMGPFSKAPAPILTTHGAWAGPGHCSVLDLPDGETEIVYHAWQAGHVGAAPGRLALVDRVVWGGGWPTVPEAPSVLSTPMP